MLFIVVVLTPARGANISQEGGATQTTCTDALFFKANILLKWYFVEHTFRDLAGDSQESKKLQQVYT